MKSNLNQNSVIYISMIGVVLSLIAMLLIVLIILFTRNNNLKNYKREISELYDKMTKQYNYTKVRTIRFKDLSNINRVYRDKYEKLKELWNKKIYILYHEFEEKNSLILKHIEKRDIKKAKALNSEMYSIHKKFEKAFLKVQLETELDNVRFEVNEFLLTNAQSFIKVLRKIINSNKKKLVRSYDTLSKELENFRIIFSNIEKNKDRTTLDEISDALSQYDPKLRMFGLKVSHALVLEKLIFSTIVNMLKKLLPNNQKSEDVSNLAALLVKIQRNYLNEPFQDTNDEVKKLLNKYYYLKNKNNIENQIDDYIGNNTVKIQSIIDNVEQKISNFGVIKSEHRQKKIAELSARFINIKKDFECILSQKNDNKNNTVFLDFDSLVDISINWINEFNKLSRYEQNESLKHEYFKSYWTTLEEWYYSLLTKREFLENTTENDLIFSDLIRFHEEILKNKTTSANEMNLFIEKLRNLYKVIQKAKTYKYMTTALMDKINKYSINNEKIALRLQNISHKLANKEFSKAYADTIQLIRKEKINVL
ncbi:hypothetical protein [Mycoplasma sp. HS2188]|uniref:hypothetical protein n=1 Tax=Mycoplasma sp. HS2188 TaxID=2976765 RepID=UPI0021A9F5F0|nr:hypothetical protein [Mycoplasma sp. HS2188]MCT4469456.1 hypothetical protein [Mycoplasma sp. HS2188]